MNRGPETSFQEGDSQTLTIFLRFLGWSSFFLRLFDVQAIFFPLSRILNAKMHARMLWRRLRIALSFSLNFSFCQNEKPFSFDQNENNATFTENLKLFQWFKMFHSFIEDGLICFTDQVIRFTDQTIRFTDQTIRFTDDV
jgi:hypothetical protein